MGLARVQVWLVHNPEVPISRLTWQSGDEAGDGDISRLHVRLKWQLLLSTALAATRGKSGAGRVPGRRTRGEAAPGLNLPP